MTARAPIRRRLVRYRPVKVVPPSLNSLASADKTLSDIDKLYLTSADLNKIVQVPSQDGTPVGDVNSSTTEEGRLDCTPFLVNSILSISSNPGPKSDRPRESIKIVSRDNSVPSDTDSDSDSDCGWDELVYPMSITLKVGDFLIDPDVDLNDNIVDLQFFTKSYKAGMKYARNLAEMLRKGAWYGLVCVELNPGPPKKGKPKVREVVKIVEKKSHKSSSNSSGGVGKKVGGFLGDLAQKAIMTITGMGDYNVKTNTLFNGAVTSNSPPQFIAKNPGSTRILHREYVTEVASPGFGFAIKSFVINPEVPASFPWLSQIALNFEQYRFHGLVFEFKTTSATAVASTNTALGSVILATQYNSLEIPFVSKLQMDQYEFAVATNPSISCIHPVECSTAVGAPDYFYCDPGFNNTGDPRFSIMGNFSIATQGQQAASTIGELWVSYDIEFFKPRLDNGVATTPQDFLVNFTSTVAGTPWTMNMSDIFAAQTNASQYNGNTGDLPIIIGTQANGYANTLVFPAGVTGTFIITFNVVFTVTTLLKTSTMQAMIIPSINTSAQPWGTAANILPDQVNPAAGNLISRQLSPTQTGQIVSGMIERYAYRITNNTTGTKITCVTNFPSAPGNTFAQFAVQVSPVWYSNN